MGWFTNPGGDTSTQTRHEEWRCFHCDTLFTNRRHAAEHFGADEGDVPACKLKHSEGHLVTYIRQLQRELASYRREDNHVLRSVLAMEAEHRDALIREEEKGFARGLADMQKHGYVLSEEDEAERDAMAARVKELEAENERLRIRLLSAAGDDLCRLSQEEIKAYSSGAVKIPPREEFIPSCERFHEQIASTSGVLTNCLTLAQLVAENAKLEAENASLRSAHAKCPVPVFNADCTLNELGKECIRLQRESNH